ncbi:MAG: sugar transferase [Cypionkella sp.]
MRKNALPRMASVVPRSPELRADPSRPRQPAQDRLSVQLALGLVSAILVPTAVVLWLRDASLSEAALRNSMSAAAVALLSGIFVTKRLSDFPGITRFETHIPIFIGAYVMVSAWLLFARLPYSTVFLTTSFALTVGAFLVLTSVRRNRRMSFDVVPYGATDRLAAIGSIELRPLARPEPALISPGSAVVADLNADLPDEWERLLARAALEGHPVYHVKQIEESLTGKVDIEHLSENSLGSLIPNRAFADFKGAVDRLVAALALVLLAVPLALVALIIRLDSPGPALFAQMRIGKGGRPFTVYNFRSMRHQQDRSDERAAAVTAEGDARITRVGAVIRRLRIDELPQLINVIRGEMSWIGPRPEAYALSAWYEAELPFYSYRHIVRPGLTGWAQVNQGHVADLSSVHDKLRYDFFYIKHFSLWLDVLILLRTARIILTGFGAK